MKEHARSIANSFSEIFFLNNPYTGLVLLLITLINPNLTLAGVIAVLSAYLFARFLNVHKDFLASGYYTYNALLVGLSVGFLFKLNLITLFFLVSLGILTFLITGFLAGIFSYYTGLPVLSLPFVIVSSFAYLAAGRYSNLYVNGLYPHLDETVSLALPFWISGYLKSLGTILFMPSVLAGLMMVIVILASSRILFVLSLLGYFGGTLITGVLTGSFVQSFANINHFNFILIAMAVGGVFLIPSPRSYLISLVAVASATVLLDAVQIFWSYYGIPAFTLPFILVSLVFIYVLGYFNFPLVARHVKATPEETLDEFLTTSKRYPGTDRGLALPFSGTWNVWQGFDGEWTHKDSWKYAYDFVITNSSGETFANKGEVLEDYYAFKKPVLSPARGRLFKVVNDLPDNPVGSVDQGNNWGNLVVIQDYRGFFVELSHFATGSIKVKEGDWVEAGQPLGLCGNSGYSPQPHIHVQVQATEKVGSGTLPFSFTGYLADGTFFANAQPEEGTNVSSIPSDTRLEAQTSFVLDQVFRYEVWENGKKAGTAEWIVKMGSDGSFYFDSGKGRLYFGRHEGTFYLYRVEGDDENLKTLFRALPRLPLVYRQGIMWDDYLTASALLGKGMGSLVLFIGSFDHRFNRVKGRYRFAAHDLITGTVTSDAGKIKMETRLELAQEAGFKTIIAGSRELRYVEN